MKKENLFLNKTFVAFIENMGFKKDDCDYDELAYIKDYGENYNECTHGIDARMDIILEEEKDGKHILISPNFPSLVHNYFDVNTTSLATAITCIAHVERVILNMQEDLSTLLTKIRELQA